MLWVSLMFVCLSCQVFSGFVHYLPSAPSFPIIGIMGRKQCTGGCGKLTAYLSDRCKCPRPSSEQEPDYKKMFLGGGPIASLCSYGL